ncbi:carbon storage regulator [Aminipila sp.]|uniref:carbon storage regulator n=1 Tax=Aminipila sp. TaxID=2060095 RepID=UPI0028A1EB8F|nr:carbon storage regulator [Aminipila sp.]
MLILTRKQGEAFLLGEDIEISIAEINGDRVRIAINAPKDVKILRKELKDAGELNKESAISVNSEETLLNITNLAEKFKEKNKKNT